MRLAGWIPKATNKFRICNINCFSTATIFTRMTPNVTKRRINNQLDADKVRFIDVITSTCFGHHYAHHQEYRSETTDRL
jgi:hypothetical protein